jgi:hypothetical protein
MDKVYPSVDKAVADVFDGTTQCNRGFFMLAALFTCRATTRRRIHRC